MHGHGITTRYAQRTMNRSDLVTALAERFAPLTRHDADAVVRVMLDTMADALARGHRVEVRDFGRFAVKRRPPRAGRNPSTGVAVAVPEKRTPHFKPGKALREAVDGGHDSSVDG